MTRHAVLSLVAVPALLVALASPSGAAVKPARHAAHKVEAAAAPAKPAQAVDINSATKEQLAALPGVGDVLAQKIIDGRPYAVKTDLKAKGILTPSVYSKVEKLVVARQAKPLVKK